MTDAETTQAIRKEIISRIDKRHLSEQAKNELVSILSFLDTLEEPVCEELEKELENHARLHPFEDSGSYRNMIQLAHHFAKWGAKRARKQTAKEASDAGWQYEYDHADDWRKPVEMGQL